MQSGWNTKLRIRPRNVGTCDDGFDDFWLTEDLLELSKCVYAIFSGEVQMYELAAFVSTIEISFVGDEHNFIIKPASRNGALPIVRSVNVKLAVCVQLHYMPAVR